RRGRGPDPRPRRSRARPLRHPRRRGGVRREIAQTVTPRSAGRSLSGDLEEDLVAAMTWQAHPLTPERWPDFERLFGRAGGYGGCWCMWFRQTGKEYEA